MLDRLKSELKERFYAEVPFSLGQLDFEEAARAFISFLALPEEFKKKFFYKIDPHDRGSNVGYLHKSRASGDLDDKEYFHYHLLAETEFWNLLHAGNPVVNDFFTSALKIHLAAICALRELMYLFEIDYPGIYGKFFPQDYNILSQFYLRFLRYNTKPQGMVLAEGHYDRGGCTLALAESSPGLRIGKDENSLQVVCRKPNLAIFMPGIHFPQLTHGDFMPAWHGVVQIPADGGDTERWAIVFFANAYGVSLPTFEEAHTPR